VIMSLAAAGWGARCATAGQCDHAIASRTAAAAGSIHFFIVISSELLPPGGDIEQNMIKFGKLNFEAASERTAFPQAKSRSFYIPS
jgi:hypothetical protein